jgi:hypothetical protein
VHNAGGGKVDDAPDAALFARGKEGSCAVGVNTCWGIASSLLENPSAIDDRIYIFQGHPPVSRAGADHIDGKVEMPYLLRGA